MKLALFYNLTFTEDYTYTSLETYDIIRTLCHICLYEFFRVEGGAKFMKHFKGGASHNILGTSALTKTLNQPN
jgi:hypothetical protein